MDIFTTEKIKDLIYLRKQCSKKLESLQLVFKTNDNKNDDFTAHIHEIMLQEKESINHIDKIIEELQNNIKE